MGDLSVVLEKGQGEKLDASGSPVEKRDQKINANLEAKILFLQSKAM